MTKNFAYQNLILVSAVVAAPYGGRFSRSQMQLCVNCRSSNPGLEIKNNWWFLIYVCQHCSYLCNQSVWSGDGVGRFCGDLCVPPWIWICGTVYQSYYLTSPEGVIVLVAHAAEEPLPVHHLLQWPHPGSVQQVPVLVQHISLQLLLTIIITVIIIIIIIPLGDSLLSQPRPQPPGLSWVLWRQIVLRWIWKVS